MPESRIVSLIASSTEILCALGMREQLVGISHECDYPPDVKSLPVCTAPKFQPDGTSYEIDQRVRAILQESLSVYRVDAQLLDSLAPTHIVTQSQCEVCAVSLKDVEQAACELIHSHPQIISLQPNSLEDIWTDIGRVGEALGISSRAEQLIEDLKMRVSSVRETAGRAGSRPKVAFVEWAEPLMAGGNWMPTLIEYAGGISLFGTPGAHSPVTPWEAFIAAGPEVIVIAPCGFDIPRALQDVAVLSAKPGWGDINAVKSNNVFVCDGNQFFNRPGPRVVESLEILAELIHPELFHFGHQGAGWVRAQRLG